MIDHKKETKTFKALGDTHRLEILELLLNNEKCAYELLNDINLSQPTLSHHMKLLEDADIVNSRKEGKWVHYSVNREAIEELREFLNIFLI